MTFTTRQHDAANRKCGSASANPRATDPPKMAGNGQKQKCGIPNCRAKTIEPLIRTREPAQHNDCMSEEDYSQTSREIVSA